MDYIFVNIKRFDVSKELGGICPDSNPKVWIEKVMLETMESGYDEIEQIKVVYLLPEGLITTAIDVLNQHKGNNNQNVVIGCQGVFKDNIRPGGNFGAFTSFKPAAAEKSLGSTWAIIGHSEERKALYDIFEEYDSESKTGKEKERATKATNSIINKKVACAFESGLNVLLCVGETAEERGKGSFEEQKLRIRKILEAQLVDGLKDLDDSIGKHEVVIGYEPIWAIGPGKVPPNGEYIEFVGLLIKDILKENFSFELPVVYGGGLKEENAAEIASLKSIDGGLIALTKFTQPIAFETSGLKRIVDKYISGRAV